MPDWVNQIGVIVALVVGLGVVAQFLRGSRDKGTITTLEQNNSALTERVALLEAGERRLVEEAKAQKLLHDAEVKALELRVEALESENERLQSQRPSAEVLAKIVADMEQHDKDIKALIVKTAASKGPPT